MTCNVIGNLLYHCPTDVGNVTVKPLMLACPLFHEPKKTVKIRGANINCRPKRDEITTVFQTVWF